ncbi:unnamed protein product (macronuclear) [Paramecium tetraurelia]|uniref:Uncharacterized protein n=1 Tax=Paramecium tetraurelia TaxID=5888 RepID=A0BV22_PARTE|nr:uncharacterized protein GSPATT00005635001 [Paramecium tetraurelia]CAK62389.1 unnamed protein product [Paramecium tetraurelia]|eukprot:XP_001429787.1 hypothetical protein (macronuclear) [Paramecium tetraurelia strain d4-2]
MDSLNSKDDKCTTMTDSAQMKSFILNKNINIKEKSKFVKITPQNILKISSMHQLKKQLTLTLPTDRSSNLSRENEQFNDKFLVENIEKKQQQLKNKTSRFKNLLNGRRIKTSGDHFQDYKEEYKKVVETGYNEIEENFQFCQASLHEQRQNLMNAEIELQENQKELELLQDQISTLKEAIFLTQGQSKKSLNDILFRNRLRQNKERKLTQELLEFVNHLSIQYDYHISSLKEYLQSFKTELSEILIENEYTEKS